MDRGASSEAKFLIWGSNPGPWAGRTNVLPPSFNADLCAAIRLIFVTVTVLTQCGTEIPADWNCRKPRLTAEAKLIPQGAVDVTCQEVTEGLPLETKGAALASGINLESYTLLQRA